MNALIPEKFANDALSLALLEGGLQRIHQGKVRDTYALPENPELLLLVATDRISIFDFVLPAAVPDKGAVLTAMTVLWLTKILKGVEHHLVAFGGDIDAYLPAAIKKKPELQKRAMIVKKLSMLPVECVVRGYLTGSGYSSYMKTGEVCGHVLQEGLHDGAKLPEPLFTPTTKAESGHDMPMSAEEVEKQYGKELVDATLSVYKQMADYASTRGIILADTKYEFGEGIILGDEAGTPDSSRFWDVGEWEAAVQQKRSPSGYDKQPVREWGKLVGTPCEKEGMPVTGIHKLDPETPKHVECVSSLDVPESVLTETTKRYRTIFKRLAEETLESFQKNVMKIMD